MSKREKPPPIPPELADEEVNKYGVPLSFWATLNPAQKNYYYNKLSKKKYAAKAWANASPKERERRYAKNREWRRNHPDEERERFREYYRNNREKLRAAWANMPPEKRARINAMAKSRRLANLDEEKRKDREWYRKNAEKRCAQWRAGYWRNYQKQLEKHRRRWAKQRSQKQITLSPDAVFRIIDKAVPKVLPRFVRDDIISAMCLAVLDGQLFVENVGKEASKFVRAYNREYDNFKNVSLDAPLAGYDGLTLLDRLADPHVAGE